MKALIPVTAVSPLRQGLIDEMEIDRFDRETQRNYIRDVGRFATFLGPPTDKATTIEVRLFQIEQLDQGVPVLPLNAIVLVSRVWMPPVLQGDFRALWTA
jgi:integrase/recombinase XerD